MSSTRPLAIVSSGMVCGVGLTAPTSCAAIRCGIDNIQETRFMDSGGEWIMGSVVPLDQPWRGVSKLVKMLVMAMQECASCDPQIQLEEIPVLFCLSELDRPGRLDQINTLVVSDAEKELGIRFHERSEIIAQGRLGGAIAIARAQQMIYEGNSRAVVIAGVDSLLIGATLRSFESRERLLTSQNSNGFIPGEAAACVIVRSAKQGDYSLVCEGVGFGHEKACVSSEDIPHRADGLVEAIRAALKNSQCELEETSFRITDLSGEQYGFKEAALALSRLLRQRKQEYDIWHPADCIGEVGSAIGPAMLVVMLAAMRKGYAPGRRVLAHWSNDDGQRAAMILRTALNSGGGLTNGK